MASFIDRTATAFGMGAGTGFGDSLVKGTSKVAKDIKEMKTNLQEIDKLLDSIAKKSKNINFNGGSGGGSGSSGSDGNLNSGLAGFSGPTLFQSSQTITKSPDFSTSIAARFPKTAAVAQVGLAVAGMAYGMLPTTENALASQQGLFQATLGMNQSSAQFAKLRGMLSNSFGNLMTSPTSASASAAIAYRGGYNPMTTVTQRLFSQAGAYSLMTGFSNEMTTQALTQTTAPVMSNRLRMLGINTRDAKGNPTDLAKIANQVARQTFGGSFTDDQLSRSLQAGGALATNLDYYIQDPAMREMAIAALRQQAKNGGKYSPMNESTMAASGYTNRSLNPLAGQMAYQSSEARKTDTYAQGMVDSYGAALDHMSKFNDKLAEATGALKGMIQGMANFKAYTEGLGSTSPGQSLMGGLGGLIGSLTGGALFRALSGSKAGGAIKSVGSKAGGFLKGAGSKVGSFLKGAGSKVGSFLKGAGSKVGSALSKVGVGTAAKFLGKTAGKMLPGIGVALGVFDGYQDSQNGGWDWGGFGTAVGAGAAGGAIGGAFFGGVGAVPGAVAGAITGGLSYAGGQLLGSIFGSGGGTALNTGTAAQRTSVDAAAGGTYWPAASKYITSGFGRRLHPIDKTYKNHDGIDIRAGLGDPVYAFRSGKVVFSGVNGAYGNCVIIDHGGGMKSLYGHMSRLSVSVGTQVSGGKVIGAAGSTGKSTAPHLHFGIQINGSWVNPQNYLSGASGVSGNDTVPVNSTSNGNATSGNSTGLLGSDFNWGSGDAVDMNTIMLNRDGITGSLNSISNMVGTTATTSGLLNKQTGSLNASSTTYSTSGSSGTTSSGGTTSTRLGKGGGSLKDKSLAQLLYKTGFRGKNLRIAYGVVMAESGGLSNAEGDKSLANNKWGYSIGLFQIRSLNNWQKYGDQYWTRDASRLYDPEFNAKAAWEISNHGKSWGAWSTYNSGAYKKYVPSAQAVNFFTSSHGGQASYASGLWSAPKDHVAKIHTGEMVLPASIAEAVRNGMRNNFAGRKGGGGSQVTINVNVNSASEAEAIKFAKRVKSILAEESEYAMIGMS